jgi:hypothetical protein
MRTACSSFNNFHSKMRSMLLSDDNIGSMPRFAPGSQVQPSVITIDDETAAANNASAEVMEVSVSPAAFKQYGKRKAGDVFSGTSLHKPCNLRIS